MNKAVLDGLWEHFRTVNGITLRAIQALPADKIDAKPCKDMRTPKELIAHMYNTMRSIADGVQKGEIAMTDEDEAKIAAGIHSKEELVRFAADSWNFADTIVRSLPNEKIEGLVKTPWDVTFPGFICINIIYDEHLHHRGQFYAFLRQLGVEPPMMWDFEHNAPEFQPRMAAAPQA
jgi:uncharacterized damage-inducible protein DinB